MNANIIPSDVPSIFDVLASLSTLEKRAIVRPNNPPPGIAGFLFDVVAEDSIELRTEVSRHTHENNTTVIDQLALPPEQITIRGFVAELADVRGTLVPLVPQVDALPANEAFLPELTPGAEEVQLATVENEEKTAAGVTSQQSLYNYYASRTTSRPGQTKQTSAFLYFYNLWLGRMLFSVETPWGIMTNMAMAVFRAEQGEATKGESEFRATFEKVRIVGNLVVATGQLAGRAALQAAAVTQSGNAGQTPQTDAQASSWLYKLANPGL